MSRCRLSNRSPRPETTFFTLDHVRERLLNNLARISGALSRPVPERRAKAVQDVAADEFPTIRPNLA